ncbi:MAG: helix-turn-helix domain-containing protein, partial [Candidatus Omnitrophica bacterium]|nr:helix-turn-helix domain-containing protein [Candidatus Omnitrophota bacterium]
MAKKKIDSYLKRIVLQEKRLNSHLGVRPLSELLKKKHKINISKSTVSKILVSSGLKEKKGRKDSLLIYKGKGLSHCGLFLLRCLDHHIGIFDYLSREIKQYFPKISEKLLRQLIVLTSFSSLINQKPRESSDREGFLRLAGLKHFPARKIDYFSYQLSQYKPKVDLRPLKKDLVAVSTIKIYFNNGHCSYLDAKMSTLWNGPCKLEQYFLPLGAVSKLINEMIKDKTVIIGYTKSFGYLSPLTFDFLKAMDKGIKQIEFLDQEERVLKELKIKLPKVSFFIGYYPDILNKGVMPMGTPKGMASPR